MSKIHVYSGGVTFRLECWAGSRTDMAAVVRVCEIIPGQSWDELAARVAEHQAKHGCGDHDGDAREQEREQADERFEVLGQDATASCLAHRRKVTWMPAPGWWIHSDHRTCLPLLDYGHPLVFVRKEQAGD